MGESIINIVKAIFKTSLLQEDLNKSLICLIPKQEQPEYIAQFRPICLSNVVIKIISKLFANMLKSLMKQLVGKEQASFIPNRQTTNNIIMTQEVIHSLRKQKGKRCDMVIKIDLEKVYDRVDWNCLQKLICNSASRLRAVILNCIKSTKLSVLWNGQQLDSFKPQQGLQQGDPLSPYLFVLCIEILE